MWFLHTSTYEGTFFISHKKVDILAERYKYMWLKIDLDGIDFHFRITNYRKRDTESWYEQWCTVDITLQSPKWLDYQISSDILLSSEIEDIRDSIMRLLQGEIQEMIELEFVEPDLTFVLTPKKNLRNDAKYSYVAPGHEIVDVNANMRVHLWHDGLTENYISLCLDRSDLEKLLIYLQLITSEISKSSNKVQELIAKDMLRTFK